MLLLGFMSMMVYLTRASSSFLRSSVVMSQGVKSIVVVGCCVGEGNGSETMSGVVPWGGRGVRGEQCLLLGALSAFFALGVKAFRWHRTRRRSYINLNFTMPCRV